MNWENYPLLLKAKEVQKILDVSKGKMYELLNSKDFPVVKVGRCFRVPRDGLKAWIERQQAK
ncbi:MAG: helix-turn-helix domain-containing protein [Armatimonadetes bacterium]|nr:helix-turn-helix domain-containing protein [Armatimonadota bacterium]